MTQPIIRVGQIWARKNGGRQVRVTAISSSNLLELEPLDYGNRSHPMARTLRQDYRIITAPPIQEQP